MARRRHLLTSLVAGAALVAGLAVGTPSPVQAQSTGNGLEETSVNTFRLDAEAGVVRVRIDITLRNVTTDQRDGDVIRQTFFDRYFVAIPVGAENVVAARGDRVLAGEVIVDPEFPAFSAFEFELGTQLFSGSSTQVTVTYDHLGAEPRDDIPWRVNAAYAAFVAFGIGDDERVTINIVRPEGYEFDEFTDLSGYDVGESDEAGSVTYTRTGVDGTFETAVGMSNDEALATTALDVAGVDIELRSWPDDPEWTAFAKERIELGIPDLEELIGSPWPVEGSFDVIQTVEPNLYGYAGWFDESTNEIAVGEELDADTIYHELSHAWFNSRLTDERWIVEGFAQVFAAEMVERTGGTPLVPERPSSSDPGLRTLASWDSLQQSDDVEAFGYGASHWVMTRLVDEVGFPAIRDVLQAMDDATSPYDTSSTAVDRINDWQRFYDLLVEIGGSDRARELFEAHVVDRIDVESLDARDAWVEAVNELRERAAPYDLPDGVRGVLERWDFDDVDTAIADADEILDLRDTVDELREQTGVDEPDEAADAFADAGRRSDGRVDFDGAREPLEASVENGRSLLDHISAIDELEDEVDAEAPRLADSPEADDFASAIEVADDRVDALETVRDVIVAADDADGFLESIGAWGSDLDEHLDDARDAISRADHDAARTAASDAENELASLGDAGARRVTAAGIAAAVALLAAAIVVIRRRRSARGDRSASGGGLVGGDEVLGGTGVDFEEDALTGAHLGGVDDGLDVPIRDTGETS